MKIHALVLVLAGCALHRLDADGGGGGSSPDASRPPLGGRDASSGSSSGGGLHASGHQILDGSGRPLRLLGVNRAGSEYACIQGWGIFDGPSDDDSLRAIRGWNANAVRIPLNEDCWLGLNGVPDPYSGAHYQDAIADFAARALGQGLFPILDLHWSAPGNEAATSQQPMPDRDHSPELWRQVALRFGGAGDVVFEPFNEPYPDSSRDSDAGWTCWRDGGQCPGVSYTAAGMQELVDAIRSTGARNLILLGGLSYSNTLSHWLDHAPNDPENNLAAVWHVYNFTGCADSGCWNGSIAPIAAQVPVVATEIGEDDCGSGFIGPLMSWLDEKDASYLGWAWNDWSGCLHLIDDFSGTPHGSYGQTFRAHLLQVNP